MAVCGDQKWLRIAVAMALSFGACRGVASGAEQNEQKLLAGFAALQNLQLEQSLQQFSELSEVAPNYKLAKMLKADLLALRAGIDLSSQKFRAHYPKTIAALKKEARVRWQFSQGSVLFLPPLKDFVLKSAGQPYVVLVDLAQRRLHLYKNLSESMPDGSDEWLKVEDFYISRGASGTGKRKEGDRRTPLGVYLIADTISQQRLPDLYGVGALPINYPNLWDRTQKRTGSGIWLHGVPSDTYARNPDASRGCVVLTNDAMQKLVSDYQLPLSTPVILWDRYKAKPHFEPSEQVVATLKSQVLEQAPDIDWSSVSVFRYPNESQLFLVTFAGKQTGRLIHQYWQGSLAEGWQKVAEQAEPIEIPYKFKWE